MPTFYETDLSVFWWAQPTLHGFENPADFSVFLVYNEVMGKKSLLETNPYLKDPELRKALFNQSVSSSTAVEGVMTKYPKLSKAVEKKLRIIISAHEPSTSYK